MSLEARIETAKAARRAAIAAKDHAAATETMKVLSALAGEQAGIAPDAVFNPKDVRRFNRRPRLSGK